MTMILCNYNKFGWMTIHWGFQVWQGLASEIPDYYLDLIFKYNPKH